MPYKTGNCPQQKISESASDSGGPAYGWAFAIRSRIKNSGGGVSSWVHETFGPKLAYYAGWTYWACHVTYIASKGSGGLKALSWAIFRNAEVYDSLPTLYVQLATLAVFLFFCWFASRGLNPLKQLATVAGTSMFVMSILYILMMFAAPAINPNGGYLSLDFSFDKIVPQFNVNYQLSILYSFIKTKGSNCGIR